MLDVLRKKAKGYQVTETVQEFGFDQDGNKRLIKERVSKKKIPPDITAIKTYLEVCDNEIYSMTSEELLAEKERLIRSLEKEKKNGKEK
ncbi:MAG: hypothetical protein GX242_04050 [Clostridiales bacterium]|jgi:hypothetical protein|nr:hypothetical protein [Clostridiales bacterium]